MTNRLSSTIGEWLTRIEPKLTNGARYALANMSEYNLRVVVDLNEDLITLELLTDGICSELFREKVRHPKPRAGAR
jgi:hypothetical protein